MQYAPKSGKITGLVECQVIKLSGAKFKGKKTNQSIRPFSKKRTGKINDKEYLTQFYGLHRLLILSSNFRNDVYVQLLLCVFF